jgi:ferredoxin
MIPAADWLLLPESEAADRVPYVLAVDANDRLHRVIVDARLMQATRRCLLLWHRLQEHGGINNSHAEQALAREKAAWEAQKEQELAALRQAAASTPPAVAAATAAAAEPAAASAPAAAAVVAEAAPAPSSDQPWIETARCSSCNECQNINDKLFGYNENKQAFIKDLSAGTYKEMVEAAEACQVAIIHPGKPWNPSEPGLEELLERAKPFMA